MSGNSVYVESIANDSNIVTPLTRVMAALNFSDVRPKHKRDHQARKEDAKPISS